MVDLNTLKDVVVLHCIFPELCGVTEEFECYTVKVNPVAKVKRSWGIDVGGFALTALKISVNNDNVASWRGGLTASFASD